MKLGVAAGGLRGAKLAGAFALHACVLALPLLLVGRADALSLAHPELLAWVLGALALQAAELHAARGRPDQHTPGSFDGGLAGLTGVLLLLCQWTAALDHVHVGGLRLPLAVLAAGALLVPLGIALRHASMRALGSGFVSSVEGRASAGLLRAGPYGWVRHPSELGLVLYALGVCLLLRSGLGAGAVVVGLLPLVLLRTRREDRALRGRYGEAHAAYARAVGSLLPRPASRAPTH